MKPLFYFVAGFASVFILKYIIVGLTAWNNAFHPGRVEPANLVATFGKPFLGAFS